MKKILLSGLLLFCLLAASAQLVVSDNSNGTQLAQILAGTGVTISNVQFNCPQGASGTFNCVSCDLGIQNGIVLTSGSVDSVPGPNDLSGSGNDNLASGDPDLDNLVSDITYDACVLEFDMKVLSDSVQFNYVFGSEEYLEFVGSTYNDVFAFFISGPGVPFQNIALVPGTATPVSINNVNSTSYSQYYVDNGDGFTSPYDTNPYYIQYDGFTKVLTAKKYGLQPCQTYHLKLAVADVGDGVLDSGVFLEANSLTSNLVSLDSVTTDVPNVQDAVEGCIQGIIRFHLQNPAPTQTVVHFTIGGTATNGVDYLPIVDSVIFQTGDTLAAIHIHPISDGIVEGTETVVISLYTPCDTLPYDSAVLLILDSFGVQVFSDTSICAGSAVQLNATGANTYLWSPATGLSATNIPNPVATPAVTTTYKCTTTVGICQATDTLTITVMPPPFSVNAGNDTASCTSPSIQLNAVVTGNPVGGNPFVYSWTPASGLSSTNVLNPVASPATPTNYVIHVTSGTCVVSDTVNVAIGSLQVTIANTPETCYGYLNGTAIVTPNGQSPYVYAWSTGATTPNISGLAEGAYNVTVHDNSGCSATASTIVGSTTPIYFSTPVVTLISCFGGSNGSITVTASGGGGGINYNWSTGSNTGTATNLSGNTPYTVTATDINGCSADTVMQLSQPTQLAATITATDVTCFGLNNGAATVNITGGTNPYTPNWSNGDANATISNLAQGNYSVTITDANGCTANANTTINEPALLTIAVTSTPPLCANSNDGTVTSNTAGGTLPYQFGLLHNGFPVQNNASGNFNGLSSGNYTVIATDANNCTANASTNLVSPNPDVLAYSMQPTSCYGSAYSDGSISVTPISLQNGPYVFSIDGGANQNSGDLTGLKAGYHLIAITNANGCVTDTGVIVSEPLNGVVSIIPADTTLQLGQNIQLVSSFGPYADSNIVSYMWQPQDGLSCIDCPNPIVYSYNRDNQYTLTVTYNDHCIAVAASRIFINGYPPVYIPNAFTPNGDGNNDVFLIYGESIRSVGLTIFNRWGEMVFDSGNHFAGWDGTYKGQLQNPGLFTYSATITFLDGKQLERKGSLALIR